MGVAGLDFVEHPGANKKKDKKDSNEAKWKPAVTHSGDFLLTCRTACRGKNWLVGAQEPPLPEQKACSLADRWVLSAKKGTFVSSFALVDLLNCIQLAFQDINALHKNHKETLCSSSHQVTRLCNLSIPICFFPMSVICQESECMTLHGTQCMTRLGKS